MANSQIKTRIIHKHDTEANWNLATNFIPKQGEIIIYDKDSNYSYERFKIGDGTTLVSSLPFANDALKAEIQTLLDGKASTSSVAQLTSKVDGKVDKDGSKVLSTNDYTTAEKNKLAGIATGAQVNQNAFSNVVVGSTTIAADSKTDTLTFVAGTNITLTPDATNDKITIAAKNYSNATTSAAGLMSADDKTKFDAAISKLDGIAAGANKTVVDTALSPTSTNPVQNKVINTALSGKQATITGAATTITGSNLTASRVLVSDSNGKVAASSSITTTELGYLDGVTSGIQNQLDSKLSKTGSVPEANLVWGGKNFSGSYGPIDAAMISTLGADRLAFGKPAGVKIEYSTDSGTTWLDYGATDEQKNNLFSSGGADANFIIGKNSTKSETIELKKYLLRITIDTDSFRVYTVLNKFAIYITTNGSSGCYCTIDASLESTPTTFVTFANQIPIAGWSGWNIINTSGITTYGNSAANQYGKIRFTFGCTEGTAKNYTGLTILNIMGFGGVGWATPSNMAKLGHLYSWDSSQNVVFPARVSSSGGFSGSLSGNATSATKATQDASGNVITSTYATKTELGNKVDKVSGKGLSTQDFTDALKNKLDGIANNANNYSLPTASSSTKGGVKTGAAITDTTGYTAVHIKDGVIYYKDTNTNLVTSVFGRTGAVTLTKSDVTTALGYTPPTTDTNTHYTTRLYAGASGAAANAAATNPYLKVTDDNTYRNQIQFKGSGATTVSSDANGVITISSTDTNTTYSTATSSTLGLVKIGYTTSGKNYAVQLSNGQMYVNVPWTDTNTTYSAATTSAAGLMSASDKSKLDGITSSADSVSFSRSLTSGTKIGTITINGTGTDLYCQTNTNTTYSAGTGLSLSGTTFSVKTGYTTSGKNYKVQADTSGNLYVNVPWTNTDTNTTYSAGTGLSLSGTTFSVSTVPVANGGTGSTTAAGARSNLGIPKISMGTSSPSGGSNGDVYFKYS